MIQTLEEMKKKAREEFDECFPYIDGNNGFGELDHVKDFVDEIIEQVYNARTEEVVKIIKALLTEEKTDWHDDFAEKILVRITQKISNDN